MTLLNTAANLGGTYPASLVMWLLGALSQDPTCTDDACTGGRDPYVALQLGFMVAGCLWILLFRRRVQHLEHLPDEAWRTHLDEPSSVTSNGYLEAVDVELGGGGLRNTTTRKDR